MSASSRPFPRLSATLNNCALHGIVPALLERINVYAVSEEKVPEPIPAEYTLLKDLFAEYYDLNPKKLTWRKLQQMLVKDVKNNPLAQQLMLGPVLRAFMVEKGDAHSRLGEEKSARYEEVTGKRLYNYLCKWLGFNLVVHEYVARGAEGLLQCDEHGYALEKFESGERNQEARPTTIHLYNEGGGHWELAPNCGDAKDDIAKLREDARDVAEAHERLSSGHTGEGLELLKKSINTLTEQEKKIMYKDTEKLQKKHEADLAKGDEKKYIDDYVKAIDEKCEAIKRSPRR